MEQEEMLGSELDNVRVIENFEVPVSVDASLKGHLRFDLVKQALQNSGKMVASEVAALVSGYIVASTGEKVMDTLLKGNPHVNSDFFTATLGVFALAGVGLGVSWIRFRNPGYR